VESALMSGGVIILITAAGGAFGAMLQAAQIGPAIQGLFAGEGPGTGLVFLFLAFAVSSLIKIAQGSSTVAMITGAGMIAAMLDGNVVLPFNIVYIALAIASGSLVGSWMNDSGFWVFTKMGGLTEIEALKSWTPLLALLGSTAMAVTVVLALLLPMSG
jgi:gluconate:H+ symporter, GntP family